MLKFKLVILSFCFLFTTVLSAQEIKCTANNVSSEFSEDGLLITTTLEGNVKISIDNIVILCERAIIDHVTGSLTINNSLTFSQGNFSLTAENLEYNIKKDTGKFLSSRFYYPPFYGRADIVEKMQDRIFAETCMLTSCDKEKPHYHFSCGKIQFTEEKLSIKNLKLYFGNVPIFYFPGYSYNLKTKKPLLSASIGYKTEIGNGIAIIFNNTLKDTNLDMQERIDIGTRGSGAGFTMNDSTVPDTTCSVKKFQSYIFKKYGNSDASYGFIAEFQQEFPNRQNVIVDWRWMKTSEFFRKHLYDQYLEKSKNPNYLSYTKVAGESVSATRFIDNAHENFLSPARIPEFEFTLPYLTMGNWFGSLDVIPTRFVDIEGNEYTRVVADTEFDRPISTGQIKLTPFIRFRNIFYSHKKEDLNNFVITPGINFGLLAKKENKNDSVVYFSPSISIFSNFPSRKKTDFNFDFYDVNPEGTFSNFQLCWDFWRDGKHSGNITAINFYDIGRNKFGDSIILWGFDLGKKWILYGQERINFSDGGLREMANTVVFGDKDVQIGCGNRYISGNFDGITAFFDKKAGKWEYGFSVDYDMKKDKFTRQRFYLQKQIHCLTVGIMYSKASSISI
ncbi:MAG: hypothetical protein ACPL3Q_07840, partial [Candidatus Ratteibacteria bacterium]